MGRRVLFLSQDATPFEHWKLRNEGTFDDCMLITPWSILDWFTLGGAPADVRDWELVIDPYWSDALDRALWSDTQAWVSMTFGIDGI